MRPLQRPDENQAGAAEIVAFEEFGLDELRERIVPCIIPRGGGVIPGIMPRCCIGC